MKLAKVVKQVISTIKHPCLDGQKLYLVQPVLPDGTNTGVPIPEPARDSVAHIIMGLKSGLLPSDLTKEEKDVMEVFQGKEWYKNYGFDSTNAETTTSDKKKIDTQNQ